MTSGIYEITSIHDRCYIGSSINVESRLASHKNALRRGRHPNRRLQRAFSALGEKQFRFDVLEVCAPEKLAVREQWWIDNTGSADEGYNIARTAAKRLSAYERKLREARSYLPTDLGGSVI